MYELAVLICLLAFGYYTWWVLRGEGVFARGDHDVKARRSRSAPPRIRGR